MIARIVGERLSKGWGQQVLIENRLGGGTNIANEMVVRSEPSEPDGHTVLMGGSSQATARGLYGGPAALFNRRREVHSRLTPVPRRLPVARWRRHY